MTARARALLSVLLALLLPLLCACNGMGGEQNGGAGEEDASETYAALTAFAERLANADSYSADIAFDAGIGHSDREATLRVDGRRSHLTALLGVEEHYTERWGDGAYVYTVKDGAWQRDERESTEQGSGFDVFFKSDGYTYGDGAYQMKQSALPEGFSAVSITLDGGECRILAEITRGEEKTLLTLRIYAVGETTVTLPSTEQ